MKVSVVFILATIQCAASLKFDETNAVSRVPNEKGLTLKKWIENTKCLNVASQPLMNTQFAQLGALDALNDAGLLSKVTGYSGVSSGAFVMALAATKNFSQNSKMFRETWPGWGNLVPGKKGEMKDPEVSKFYRETVLSKVLPATFEELKVPMAVVATSYADEDAAAKVDEKRADAMVISDGPLANAVIVSSSAMMGKGCPKCESGFHAKEFKGKYPVADGFLKDEYGTLGLAALKTCKNLLHFQPQNYAHQLTPTKNKNLDTQPENVVSLGLDVPSSAIMSMGWVSFLEKIHSFRRKLGQPTRPLDKMVANMDDAWEKIQYESSYQHTMESLDKVMTVDANDDDVEEHYFVDLDTKPHWADMRSFGEKMWDQKFDLEHTKYWDKTAPRRDNMVGERNKQLKDGKLSFKMCGNGQGAPDGPKCKHHAK